MSSHQPPPFMEPESVLNLFDSFWFHLGILETPPKTSISPTPDPQIQQINHPSNQMPVSRQISFLARSKSDELSSFTAQNSSPDSVLKPHLQTILSDREISSENPKSRPQVKEPVKRYNRREKRLSKSLSELEFEEVKGFIDLGFVFSEEDKDDSTLVEIIPGLQKLRQKTESFEREKEESRRFEEAGSGMRARPYLSEAWEFNECRQRELEKTLMKKWTRVPLNLPLPPPPAARNEMDIKDSLKSWAHTVASAVR